MTTVDVDAVRHALATATDRGGTQPWVDLGMLLEQHERTTEAVAAYETAWRNEQAGRGTGDTFVNLAIALRDSGRASEALALLEQNLPRAPNPYGLFVYGMALLAAGRFREGWDAYEFRWMTDHFAARRPRFEQPSWNGQDVRGKTVLVRAEQGLGDTIQFARYARLLCERGARVVMKVHDGFESFARGFADVDQVFDYGEAPADFDYYIHTMSLPRAFATDTASIPAHVPYVVVSAARAARWAARIGAKDALRVGLVWAGGPSHHRDRFRSVPLETLAPLARVPGVRWFALQKGSRENDPRPSGFRIDALGTELLDFNDTAAAIGALDLVISVDTAVAHLAGALGQRVWLLLPTPADFRWLEEREDTPWYPTMRLFRQHAPGDWSGVAERVAASLATMPPAPQVSTIVRESRPLEFTDVTETRYGIVQSLAQDADETLSLRYYGEWLEAQLDWWGRWVRPGARLLEVGAGVGAHTLWASRVVGTDGHVLVSEPDALRLRVLRQNLRANGVANTTVVDDVSTTVDALALDRLDCLKITLSQDPASVIEGAAQSLWRLRPTLCCTVATQDDAASFADAMRGYGYRSGWRGASLFNPANFNRRTDDITHGSTVATVIAIPEELDVDDVFRGGVELG